MNTNGLYTFQKHLRLRRGMAFGIMIIGALLAFEIFNFGTTDFALHDLLGDLDFIGIQWSTILAIAFCGIDFAGIARIFTPESGGEEPAEVWYLFGAWLLAATMNAMLTWWGVSIAILNDQTLGNAVIGKEILLEVVPIFVAVLVWLSRVLLIGTFSVAGERLFSQSASNNYASNSGLRSTTNRRTFNRKPASAFRPAPKPSARSIPEPNYRPVSMRGRSGSNQNR